MLLAQNFTMTVIKTRCDLNTGSVALNSVLFGSAPYTYSIDGGTATANAFFTDLAAGSHTIKVIDNTGLDQTETIEIENLSTPELFILSEDMMCSTQLGFIEIDDIWTATPPYTFYLDSVLQEGERFEDLTAGFYTVTLQDANGCWSKRSVQIDNDCIDISHGVSPNEDGINDTWEIKDIERYPDSKIKVFNRHGHTVFNSVGYTEPWDCKSLGIALPIGTYYYIIKLDESNPLADVFTGWVAIVK